MTDEALPSPEPMPRARAVALSPILVIAAATAMVGLHEERDDARGQVVELLLREVRQPLDAPWHTAFVSHVGYWSHFDHTSNFSSWPLPPTGDCNDLARFAKEKGILSAERPMAGEIFLLWSAAQNMFVHAGIVAAFTAAGYEHGKKYYQCATVEGNTNEFCRLNDRGMHRNIRKLSPERGDRFIRWADLDPRAIPSEPAVEHEVYMGRQMVVRAA